MKKLMIAAFAVAFAAVAQAAAINWSSSWATDAQGNDLAAGAQAYLLTTAYAVADTIAALEEGTFDASTAIASATTLYNVDLGAYIAASSIDTTLEGSHEFYMVLLNGATESATEFMIVDPITVSVKSTGSTNVNFYDLSDTDGTSLYAWQPMGAAVPEPTSALMLLVGLAGLALKRKVA